MRAAGKQSQHTAGIVTAHRLSQDLMVDHNDCIRSEHECARPALRHVASLLARDALGEHVGRLVWPRRLGDIAANDVELREQLSQQLPSPRRCGGQDQHCTHV